MEVGSAAAGTSVVGSAGVGSGAGVSAGGSAGMSPAGKGAPTAEQPALSAVISAGS